MSGSLRPDRRARRLRRAAVAVSAVIAVLCLAAAATVRIPEGHVAAIGRVGAGGARLAGPGWRLRLPFVESVVLLTSVPPEVRGTFPRVTPEGATLEVPFRALFDPRSADPDALLREVLDGDLEAAVRRVAAESETAASPQPDSGARRVLEASLRPLGLVAGSLVLGTSEPRAGVDRAGDALQKLRASWNGPRHPVLVIGVDSADWAVMGPMIERGQLPALRALRDRGAWGVLRSAVPMLSPLLWTTVATGRTPDEHGIVDFLAVDAATGRPVPISSRLRRTKALWSILSDLGKPTLTVGWWATWPAERVVGEMITDRVAYSLFEEGKGPALADAIWPPELAPSLKGAIVAPSSVSLEEVRRIVEVSEGDLARAREALARPGSWSDPLSHLLRILAATRTYHNLALARLRASQPPLTLVYYEGLDEVNHRFAHYADPAMRWADPARIPAYGKAVENFYRLQDALVGELIDSVAPDTSVLVVSDHGFAWGDRRPTDVPPDIEGKPGRWHTISGVLLAAGPTVIPGRLPHDPTILDVAPTILALLSLPRALDLPGRAVARLVEGGERPAPPQAEIATYETPRGTESAGDAGASPVDAEMIAKLTALGYIGGAGTPPSGTPAASPGTSTGHLNAGNVHLLKRDYRAAETEFRAALALSPGYVPALLGLGQCLVEMGREEEGWRKIEAAMTEGADLDAGLYLKVARYYRSRGRPAQGAALYERLPRREGLEPARRTSRALLLGAEGDHPGAERELREALRADPGFVEALQEVYVQLTRRGSLADLVRILEDAAAGQGDAVAAANLLALTYERMGRAAEAEAVLRRALERRPEDAATLTNLAGILLRRGDVAAALPHLRRARASDPSNIEAIANLIVALGRSNEIAEARSVFRDSGPSAERPEVLNAMAYACYLNGAADEARDLVRRSLARRANQEEARRLLEMLDAGEGGESPISPPPPSL